MHSAIGISTDADQSAHLQILVSPSVVPGQI